MELLRRPTRCCLRPRPRRCVLGVLAVLGSAAFLASHGLPRFLSSGEHATAAPPPPPPPSDFLLAPDTCRLRAPFLLVLVASAPGHAAERAAVRETWGGARRASGRAVRTLFVLGLPESEPALQASLAAEAARHGDLLQGRFADTYANLTRKTLALLGWARAYCAGAHFLAKVDDDVFLNVPALVRHLAGLATPRAAYLGHVLRDAHPVRDPLSRHHVPSALYAPALFPPYCSGSTYVLSPDAADAVLGAARLEPLVPVEDAFVGICAHRAGITPRDMGGLADLAYYPLDPCCYRKMLLSVHGLAPATMRDIWLRPGPPCSVLQRTLGRLRCKVLSWLAAL